MNGDNGVTADRAEEVRRRAYNIWERDGRPHGRHDEHWHEAEHERSGNGGGKPAGAGTTDRDAAVAPTEPQTPGAGPDPLVTTPM